MDLMSVAAEVERQQACQYQGWDDPDADSLAAYEKQKLMKADVYEELWTQDELREKYATDAITQERFEELTAKLVKREDEAPKRPKPDKLTRVPSESRMQKVVKWGLLLAGLIVIAAGALAEMPWLMIVGTVLIGAPGFMGWNDKGDNPTRPIVSSTRTKQPAQVYPQQALINMSGGGTIKNVSFHNVVINGQPITPLHVVDSPDHVEVIHPFFDVEPVDVAEREIQVELGRK